MCDVCDAGAVITAAEKGKSHNFRWPGKKHVVAVEVDSEHTKFGDPEGPNKVRVKANKGRWSRWFATKDLASVMGRLGTDVKWEYVRDEVKEWLDGEKSTAEIVTYLTTNRMTRKKPSSTTKKKKATSTARSKATTSRTKRVPGMGSLTQKQREAILDELEREFLGEKKAKKKKSR